MTGAVVAVELVGLAEALELLLGAVDLRRRRVVVIVAEDAKQRAVEVGGHRDRRDGTLFIELTFVVDDDATAPAVDRGVDPH